MSQRPFGVIFVRVGTASDLAVRLAAKATRVAQKQLGRQPEPELEASQYRPVATRYDNLAPDYLALVQRASSGYGCLPMPPWLDATGNRGIGSQEPTSPRCIDFSSIG